VIERVTAREGAGQARSAAGWSFLRCPRCGLGIRPRVSWLAIEHCPRCVAQAHIAVRLVSSPLPTPQPHKDESPPGGERDTPRPPAGGHVDRRACGYASISERALRGIRELGARTQPGDLPPRWDRDLARLLGRLEDNCAEAVTISELQEHAIGAAGQAIDTLQLTGDQIERVPIRRPNSRNTTGYRLRRQASRSSDPHETTDDAR
jgi:uncharacterized C2H2 Zn-finger protein